MSRMEYTNIKVALTSEEFAHAFLSAYSDEGHIYLKNRNQVFFADNAHLRGKLLSSTYWNTAEDYIDFLKYDADKDAYLFDLESISNWDFNGVDYHQLAVYFAKKGVPLKVPRNFDGTWMEYVSATQLLEYICETDQVMGYRFRKSGEATYVYLKKIIDDMGITLFYKVGISANPDERDFSLKLGARAESIWQVKMPTFAQAYQTEQEILARYKTSRIAPNLANQYLDNGFTECINKSSKGLEKELPAAPCDDLFDKTITTTNLDSTWNLADKYADMRQAKITFATDLHLHNTRIELKETYTKRITQLKTRYQHKIDEADYKYQCSEPRNDFKRERKLGEWLGDLIASQDRRVQEERAHREWEVKRNGNPTRLALLGEKRKAIESLIQEWMQLAKVATREELGL